MAEQTQRRLAAIVLADVVGYSRLMGADETGTLDAMRAHRRELWDPAIARFGGRVVNRAGDSALIEFASAVAAVESAVAIQSAMPERNANVPEDRRVRLRIGINIGEVVVDGEEIYGDGVNVAARLQALAPPGGIALSGNVYENIANRLDLLLVDDGQHSVKNIARPVHVWRWSPGSAPAAKESAETMAGDGPPSAPFDKPSIAVLPFNNMSGDPEQEYFADGIAEDVITALSRFSSLFVIARNSSFSYKGTSPDIRLVARELGVRYVVEGSVRKAGNRVRITAQLIDAASGNHIWADRFDGSLEDVFDLQDRITEQIVVAVEPEIGARERERAKRKPPESLDAWELVQRGLSHFNRFNKVDHDKAVRFFQNAIALDQDFSMAHANLAYALMSALAAGYDKVPAETLRMARKAAERAVSTDSNDPLAHVAMGRVHIYAGEPEMAIAEMQNAIAINPNFARGHQGLGWAYQYGAGLLEEALPHHDNALRLSPRDPLRWRALIMKGSALRTLGRHEEAVALCRQACQVPDSGFTPLMNLAAALAEAGRQKEAQDAVAKAMQIQPAFSISYCRSRFIGMHEIELDSLLGSLRKAGVPEQAAEG